MDYEHLPFKCRNCQEHGHFQRYCPKLTAEKQDAEGWQKAKKGKTFSNTKNKEKMNQAPPKKGNPAPNPKETSIEVQNPAHGTEAGEVPGSHPSDSGLHRSASSLPKDFSSLGSETGADSSEEGDTEASSPSVSPNQPKRGRKPEKKRREE